MIRVNDSFLTTCDTRSPLTQLGRRMETLPRDRTIVAVCASGHRSAVAARALRRAGFEVENLKGGMHAWAGQGLPVERRR